MLIFRFEAEYTLEIPNKKSSYGRNLVDFFLFYREITIYTPIRTYFISEKGIH